MEQEMEDRITMVRALMEPSGSHSASTIHINAGSVGIWVCVSLFAVTLAVVALACLFVALQLQDLRKADDTFQAYIHAGYVQQEPKETP